MSVPHGSEGSVRKGPAGVGATLYALLVSVGLFLVGIGGLVGDPELPRGTIGAVLNDLLRVDPVRDVLRVALGLLGVGAVLLRGAIVYCLLAGVALVALGFAALGGALLETGGSFAPLDAGPLAGTVYLALGTLGLLCARTGGSRRPDESVSG